jgi:hypothetical protein
MKPINLCLYIFILTAAQNLYSTRSVVYNFRIAQITKEHVFETENIRKHTVIGLLFDEVSQKRYDNIHTNYFGGLGTFIYSFGSYFFRTDFAVSLIQQKSFNSYFSDTQTDDLLFSLGKNFKLRHNIDLTLSGIFGVPTHKVYALLGPDFGFGQFGIGAQLDNNYKFNSVSSLLLGSRYVYFIPRSARDTCCNRYEFTTGNLIDFLVANKNVWGKHGLEVGFTPRFAFGAKIFPNLDNIVEKTNYIRTTWYGVYQYKCMIGNTVNRFLFNIASGFEPTPHKYGNKYIVFVWGAWDIKF